MLRMSKLVPTGSIGDEDAEDVQQGMPAATAREAWQRGVLRKAFAVPAAATYQVSVTSNITTTTSMVTVNGASEVVRLNFALPLRAFIFLGTYLPTTQDVTVFDDLHASRLSPDTEIAYYGYWGAAGAIFGNHLEEVSGFTNMNMVFVDPEVLDSCAPHSCIIYAGWQFFPNCPVGGPCPLAPDATSRFASLMIDIGSRIDKVAGIYIKDEPNGYGITAADLDSAVAISKSNAVSAALPTMIVFYPTNLSAQTHVPSNADWIGVDHYCASTEQLEAKIGILEGLMVGKQRQFLLPESDLVQCPGDTDATLASRQQMYVDVARRHPSVIGILNFRNWADQSTIANPLSSLPLTVGRQQQIGASILFNAGRR